MNENLKKRLASLGVAAGIAISGGAASSFNVGERDTDYSVSYAQDVDSIDRGNDVESSIASTVDTFVSSYDFSSDSLLERSLRNVSPESFSTDNGVGSNVSTNVNVGRTVSIDSIVSNDRVEGQETIDSDSYELMKDSISYSFNKFNKDNESLSSALESTYGIKLSDRQKNRYDSIMKDTYEAYKKAISAYESGDMSTFREIRDEVLNGKKYLNLDDLVDILSININLQGDYIKDSSKYSINNGKLVIDGVTVDSIFSDATYVDQSNFMSLIQFYDNGNKSSERVLDIMQVPMFVTRQATNPTNLTLFENGEVYTYDENELRKKFGSIKEAYASIGEDGNGKYAEGYTYYFDMLSQYYTSYDCKVGYFSGKDMKDFLVQYQNGIENIKVPDEIRHIGIKDWDFYSLMQDANGYALERFNKSHSSLSEALEGTYNVELSAEQKARYDSIMQETCKVYNRGISAYQSGHVSEFRKICDEVLNEKKYLNFDDLVDIIAMNINSQGVVINNSKNYKILDGKLVIDGITLESLLTDKKYVNQEDVMSLIDMYYGCDEDSKRVLDVMQVPIFVARQATNPTCLTLVNNNSTYSYDYSELKKKFDSIEDYYENSAGVRNFFTDYSNGKIVLNGYDNDNNFISLEESKYKAEMFQYQQFLFQFLRSQDARVGYFDGAQMKEFLSQYDNGNTNIKVIDVDNSVGFVEYDSYSLMQDTLGFALNRLIEKNISLSDLLESTYNVELSAEQKARYDTLIRDTYDEYRRGIDAYLFGDVEKFRKISDEIVNDKKFMNMDDVVDILSININSQDKLINDSSKYSMSGDKLTIDNCVVEKLFTDDYSDVMDLVELYNNADESRLRVLNILRAPKQVIIEATNPTCFSLMVNGVVNSYNKGVLEKKKNNIDNYLSDTFGLRDFGIERTDDDKALYYGFDESGNKQYIDYDVEHAKDLSVYLNIVEKAYDKSKDSTVGYFDGPMLRSAINSIEESYSASKTR